MGMAASQGRLLMLTARLHDVELRAQQLQNAKLQLSTQQDAAYEEYQKALDATTLTMAAIDGSGVTSNQVGTFNNIFGMGAARPANMSNGTTNQGYILLDSRGRVVVEDDIYEAYQHYANSYTWSSGSRPPYGDNAYSFAWYMVEGETNGHDLGTSSGLKDAMLEVLREHSEELRTYIGQAANVIQEIQGSTWPGDLTDPDNSTWNWLVNNDNAPNIVSWVLTWAQDPGVSSSATPEQQQILDNFINYFWSHYGQAVFNKAEENNAVNPNGDSYNSSEFNYYVRIYNAIQEHGGCIPISDFDGPDGSAANNSEWLTNMLQSGQLYIEMASVDGNGAFSLDGISVSSDVNLNYSQTSQIDKVALAKAEAKYEHEMKMINKKDEKFDLQLKKIETERTAITKEYDSIKKVSDDNIERTFGIFS